MSPSINKGIRILREKGKRRPAKKLDSVNSRSSWYRLSAMDWRSKLGSITYFYDNDRGAWSSPNYFTHQEFANRITIVVLSAGTFGTGLGQIIGIVAQHV
jgi:hypothetical protein